jgi:hypothetical protein
MVSEVRLLGYIVGMLDSGLRTREVKVRVEVTLRPTVSRQVCLLDKSHLESKTRFLLLSDSCGFVDDVGRPLWREDVSVVYNSCWPSAAQSYLPRSKSALHIIYIYNFACRHSAVSYQEPHSLWIPTVYSFTCNSCIYVCTILLRMGRF